MACDQKAASRAVARIIPAFLGGLLIYSCYSITKALCIDYLIKPAAVTGLRPRISVAIGLLVTFYILFFFLVTTYLRLLSTVIFSPGYLPRGPQWSSSDKHGKRKGEKGHKRPDSSDREKTEVIPYATLGESNVNDEKNAHPFDTAGLEAFYMKDVFVCQQDGKPPWCSTCYQFKTDRSHHCSEVNRCVRKMDHFCPWVGGVVSETSFKFFIQFLFYAMLFVTFNGVVMAVFVAEHKKMFGTLNIHWMVVLASSGFFGLFLAGMLISSLQIAFRNSSTIESLDWSSKVWTLAILIPRPLDLDNLPPNSRPPFPVVCYPTSAAQPGVTNGGDNSPRRQFAILHTRPGENPFDLGDPFANLREVMGYSVFDWILPIKHSPCASHNRQDSMYALGPVVQRMKREAGLLETPARKSGHHSYRTKRRRRDGRSSDSDPSSSRSTSSRSRDERIKTNRKQTKGSPKSHRRSRDGDRSIRNNRLAVEGV
ncbi:palmitoyltransferase pfa5 [Nannizzia gypsea CBS 118893]|uniref:Palmitoyltransferase n=1 Tax=Arthroderma gypseum (strain ATCC MYA-4604 / CBS 118893) TaxID=535722 RepID=E4UUG2_ARTGP|nr:palmitoyltransferase pfa5 [Nannizzia gypsea CBS 118893]EFR00929.1 palmitoyltransferase pfa5 [Nannizzia gypsea CBS 118893]